MKTLTLNKEYTKLEVKNFIMESSCVSDSTARRRIKKLIEDGYMIEKDDKLIPISKTNKEETMTEAKDHKYEMKENFLIDRQDARLQMGPLKKAKAAEPAVEAKKAVKDEEGNVVEPAVKAKEAVEATPAVQTVYLLAKSEEVANEVMARMEDMGFLPENDGQLEVMPNGEFRMRYTDETDKKIRAAFKAAKDLSGKHGHYNQGGLALKKAAEKAAEKKEEVKEEKEPKAKKSPKKEKAPEKKMEKEDPEEETGSDEEWPGSFD